MDSFFILFDLIGILARKRYQTYEQFFSTLGLHHTEARLLTLLHQKGGTTAQDALSNLLFIDRSNCGRGLKSLEQKGYITRQNNDADKRGNLVKITAKGRKTVTKISKLRKEIAQVFFNSLKKSEARTIANLLRKALTDEEYEMAKQRLKQEPKTK